MRDAYPLTAFFAALSAWEKHKMEYLALLDKARAPTPTVEMLENYQRVWIEGYLEATIDGQRNS